MVPQSASGAAKPAFDANGTAQSEYQNSAAFMNPPEHQYEYAPATAIKKTSLSGAPKRIQVLEDPYTLAGDIPQYSQPVRKPTANKVPVAVTTEPYATSTIPTDGEEYEQPIALMYSKPIKKSFTKGPVYERPGTEASVPMYAPIRDDDIPAYEMAITKGSEPTYQTPENSLYSQVNDDDKTPTYLQSSSSVRSAPMYALSSAKHESEYQSPESQEDAYTVAFELPRPDGYIETSADSDDDGDRVNPYAQPVPYNPDYVPSTTYLDADA